MLFNIFLFDNTFRNILSLADLENSWSQIYSDIYYLLNWYDRARLCHTYTGGARD